MFTWDAQDYEKHSQAQKKWAGAFISKIPLKGSETILDLGCGDGIVTAMLANKVPRGCIVGIDNSDTMVEHAKRNHPSNTHPNLSFLKMDAAHVSFKDRFDVVFSNAALHWITDHQLMLKGIYTSLKSAGRVFLQMGGTGNAKEIFSSLQTLTQKPNWQQYFQDFKAPYSFHGPLEYSEWLRQAGFSIERVVLIPKDMEHEGSSGLAGWIRTTWLPFTEQVPKEQRNQFIQELVAEYLERRPLDAHGKAHVAMMRLEVEASKT